METETVEKQRENNVGGVTGKGFLPGQSGNPNGRPKGQSITARLRALLEKGEINGQPIKDGKQVADVLAETILKGALKGDFRFAREILERTEGKVIERVQVEDVRKAYDVENSPDDL